ncbi:helix-turn-helix domain-containing protein [Pseudolysinimonas sp.]|uniref:helix-turn-helix domain-containing protein n=1 Tax=Pseudolysinimonas sp. TaxID=2680009 RepID=UPI0037844FC6
MSRERLIVTAVAIQGLSQAEAARAYGLSESRVSRIMTRWRREGEAGLEPRSRRPKTTPTAIPAARRSS